MATVVHMVPVLAFCGLTLALCLDDAAVLVQRERTLVADTDTHLNANSNGNGHWSSTAYSDTSSRPLHEATSDTSSGPLAHTQYGPLVGAHENGYDVFRRVPYAVVPTRFAPARPVRPWGPAPKDAKKFGPGCVGSHSSVEESENCLNLNIWLPPGGKKQMPVIVYFHGGMNQHGSGQEELRHGDGIAQSSEHPVIFINFDFRLGIFGWLYGPPGSNITNNVGFLDQQLMLQWVQRNIRAFGGDPNRVTLEGHSTGSDNVMAHMVAPGSVGLFHRVILHSVPADIWSARANQERTEFMVKRLGCACTGGRFCNRHGAYETLECLKRKPAQALWKADWISEELARNAGTPAWFRNARTMGDFLATRRLEDLPGYMGWHAVVDGKTLLGDPRELITRGTWNKEIPVLLTVSKNETCGVFPSAGAGDDTTDAIMQFVLGILGAKGDVTRRYNQTLQDSGVVVRDNTTIQHMILTDKLWTCHIRSLAEDIVLSGGTAYVGMFWHSPKFDPTGKQTNRICETGATCHAAEMFYALPQARGNGSMQREGLEGERAFARRYSNGILAFVSGEQGPWVPYDTDNRSITFFDSNRTWVEKGYRGEQCEVLDASLPKKLKLHKQRWHRARRLR